ncbi:MAG: DEAD/DEAH box helicase, partial [Paracoccaceae bacterium]
NPMMKVIGLTATPYRMDSGSLIDPEEGTIFTDLCYDIELGFLVEQGYLSPLQSKKPTAVFDLSDLKPKSRGDWTESDLSEVVDTDKNNGPAVAEMYQLAHDRKKWLVFAVNVAHAHNLNRLISAGGRKSRVIEGSMDKATRAQYIAMYQRGELDCLVNVNVLSVGFDAPDVDMLALCRPTQSVGLYVQQLGRGLRISPGKHDCLVLDFAGNIAAHGPVDCIPTLPPKRKKKVQNEDGEEMAPGKVCGNPECEQFVHASVRVCPHCGHEFPKAEIAIEEEAETEAVMTLTRDVTVKPWKEVKSRVFTIHTPAGEGRISSIKCRTTVQRTKKMEAAANEFICVEHSGRAGAAAREWWIKQGGHFPAPTTLDEFMGRQDELYRLTHAIIVRDGNFWNITEHGHFDALAQTDDYEVVADE